MTEANTPQGTGSALTVSEAAGAFERLLEPPLQEETDEAAPTQAPEEAIDQAPVQEPENTTYAVKVGGVEQRVTLDEALKGYSRHADYTRKAQELATERKALEAERTEVAKAKEAREQYDRGLASLQAVLTQQAGADENLEALRESDPIQYMLKREDSRRRQEQINALAAERQRVNLQRNAEMQAQAMELIALEREKLLAAIPEFADKEKGDALRVSIRKFAEQKGYPASQLDHIYSHRDVSVLHEAMLYNELMAKRPEVTKKVAEAPRLLKPGVATSTDARSDISEAAKVLKKTGRLQDAAALFAKLA